MSENPWPTGDGPNVLLILDVSLQVERDLLENWLAEQRREAGFSGREDRVEVAIARQPEQVDASSLLTRLGEPDETLLVPLRVAWLSSLDAKNIKPRPRDLLFGNPRQPSASRARKILSKNPERARCIAGAPATLGSLRATLRERSGDNPQPQELANFIAAQAGLALDISQRRLQGSRYKVPRRVADQLQASREFNTQLRDLSTETGKPMEVLKTDAAVVMKELIATPRTFWLDVMGQLNHFIMSLGYKPDIVFDREGLERIRQMTREYPSALLWTHKTHVDGFAMNSVLFDNDFPAPHILGGVNMAFAGLGFVARRAGAIFIRRSFKDDPLYKLILREYIGYLMNKRFPLTWAFEGTRSRVGKLMPPRYGLLKYVVESAHATDARDLHIIPVAISYDLIGDVRDYAVEQAGATKQPESLRWFIGYLRGQRQPMGQIYVDFGEPVILQQAPDPDEPLALEKIAFQVGVEVNRVTPITLPSLMSLVLLGAAPRALTAQELTRELSRLIDWATIRNIRFTSHFEPDNSAQLDELADVMVSNGILTRYDDGPERVYTIAAEQHGVAGYYRNTIVHFFVNKAIAELSLMRMMELSLAGIDEFWTEAERLRDLFKFEFFYAPSEQFRPDINAEMTRLVPDWEQRLQADNGAVSLFGEVFPLVAHASLLPFVEGYRVVADVFARLEASAGLEEKEAVAQSLTYGRQAYLQRRISSETAIGKVLFSNGYKLMSNLGLVDAGDDSVAQQRRAVAQGFRELQRRLERIRAMALPL